MITTENIAALTSLTENVLDAIEQLRQAQLVLKDAVEDITDGKLSVCVSADSSDANVQLYDATTRDEDARIYVKALADDSEIYVRWEDEDTTAFDFSINSLPAVIIVRNRDK